MSAVRGRPEEWQDASRPVALGAGEATEAEAAARHSPLRAIRAWLCPAYGLQLGRVTHALPHHASCPVANVPAAA